MFQSRGLGVGEMAKESHTPESPASLPRTTDPFSHLAPCSTLMPEDNLVTTKTQHAPGLGNPVAILYRLQASPCFPISS